MSATFLLRAKTKVKGGARNLLLGKSEATRAIRATGYDRLDLLLVPIVPSPLSLRTLDQTTDFIAAHEATPDILIFLSMVERCRALHRDVVGLLPGRYANVAETVVATSAVIERMGQRRRPLGASTPASAAAAAYEALWREVSARLQSRQPSVAAG